MQTHVHSETHSCKDERQTCWTNQSYYSGRATNSYYKNLVVVTLNRITFITATRGRLAFRPPRCRQSAVLYWPLEVGDSYRETYMARRARGNEPPILTTETRPTGHGHQGQAMTQSVSTFHDHRRLWTYQNTNDVHPWVTLNNASADYQAIELTD